MRDRSKSRRSTGQLRVVRVEDGIEADGRKFLGTEASSFHVVFERLLSVGTVNISSRRGKS